MQVLLSISFSALCLLRPFQWPVLVHPISLPLDYGPGMPRATMMMHFVCSHFRFPLFTSSLFLSHQFTMLFFLHRFELPSRPHQVLHLPEPQRIHLQGPRHLLVAQIPQIPEELPVEERVGEGVDIPHLPIAEDVEALPDDGGGEGGGVREEPEVEPVREVLNVEGERLVRSEFVTGNTSEQPTPRVNVYVTDREEAPGHYHPPRDRSRVTWLHRVDPDRAGGTLLGIGQRTVAGTHERLMPRSHLVRRTINITQTRQNASSSDNASQ